jgi:hypothetical protein
MDKLRAQINEPIKQANVLAAFALCVAVVALFVAIGQRGAK